MSSLDRDRLDRWITGGRYNSQKLIVRCLRCEAHSLVIAESEFGATIWLPEECPICNTPWHEDTSWENDVL